ncbi:hypothetical protein DW184_17885 [Enterobacter cloacae]|uniref:hypothetical protein n=1 Tax=Enterobacter cloacae TaxID=550 RepID=UPI000E508EC9|nr:hypothetical protein [Enterobacter cloacae]RHH99867.1 hypothetical protein DW184_17885 [Enterobacter cloacae]
MQRSDFTNKLILEHFDRVREGTNNILFKQACTIVDEDKRFIFNQEVNTGLGWDSSIQTMYDYRMMMSPAIYDRLYQICVISLCSDIEFMFKSIFDRYGYQKGSGTGFFQRFNDVIKVLEGHGFDFNNISSHIDNLKLAFQIRHIGIHNMGYADAAFVNNTGKGKDGDPYIIRQADYRLMYNSYENLLKHLDAILP